MRVWKYNVPVDDQVHEIEMPVLAEIVHVGRAMSGFDALSFWAEVDPEQTREVRRFMVYGTGHPISRGARHHGTVVFLNLPLVWHLYEVFS